MQNVTIVAVGDGQHTMKSSTEIVAETVICVERPLIRLGVEFRTVESRVLRLLLEFLDRDLDSFRHASYRLFDLSVDEQNSLKRLSLQRRVDFSFLCSSYSFLKKATEHVDYALLFKNICYVDHSCRPNAQLRIDDQGCATLTAIQDICENCVITMTYPRINVCLESGRRRVLIKTLYGFVCKCDRCVFGSQEIPEIKRLSLNCKRDLESKLQRSDSNPFDDLQY